MSKSFDLSTETPVSVKEAFSAFGDEDYWLARVASYTAGKGSLESLVVDADGGVTVATTVSLLRDRLPKVIGKMLVGDLKIVWNETWASSGADKVCGNIRIAMRGTPLSGFGTALMTTAGAGSRLQYTATIDANVPLVGGKIETYIGTQLARPIDAIQRFTTEWIARHG